MTRVLTPSSLALLPLSLAACGGGSTTPTVVATNASVAEVASKVDAATGGSTFVSPGHWQGTMAISEISIPGMPAELAKTMKTQMGGSRTFESCLTPDEAKRPKGEFFGAEQRGCTYEHFTMAGGTIDAVMKCTRGPTTQTMTMKGSYSPDTYRMSVTSVAKGDAAAGPATNMTIAMTMDGRRTGDCTGKEKS
jgi:hypothetical protein